METMRQIIRLFFHCEQSQVYYGFKLPELAVQLRTTNSVVVVVVVVVVAAAAAAAAAVKLLFSQ